MAIKPTKSQVADVSIVIDGLAELRRDLRALEPEVAKGITKALHEAGDVVSKEAKSLAPRGPSGMLSAKIRTQVTRGSLLFVRDAAMSISPAYPKGYNYPRVIEYGQGGRQAFLLPALEAKAGEVEDHFGRMLDRLAASHGWH